MMNLAVARSNHAYGLVYIAGEFRYHSIH